MNAREHYDSHLATIYSWMSGDFETRKNDQKKWFKSIGLNPQTDSLAYDLGSGHGLQSVALAEIGYSVTAVDFNGQLLKEPSSMSVAGITTVQSDIIDFLRDTIHPVDLIVCMGDTLTHLKSIDEVSYLIGLITSHLKPVGTVVFSFRDYSIPLELDKRFIPVKSDDNRILTCFLEYLNDHVMVYDLVHEKQASGWIQKISCYPKLRLGQQLVRDLLEQHQIHVTLQEVKKGMVYIAGNVKK